MTEYNRVSGYLNKIFDKLNARYFENALSKPVITIQSTPKAYGHVTVFKVWESDGKARHELNIGAGTLSRPIENTVATMVHEMVHLYCMDNNIKDTSRNGLYHNKNFKREAEKRGLIITQIPTYGWTHTEPADDLIQWCIDQDLEEIRVTRLEAIGIQRGGKGKGADGENGNEEEPPKKSSTRKYVCPCCHNSVRATKDLKLICGDCYEKENKITYLVKGEKGES